MNIGRMDQRITFRCFTELPDGAGGITRAWADFAKNPSVWANVRTKAFREVLTEGRVNAAYTVLFTIYNRSDVSELDAIVWRGEHYNIRGVMRTGDRDMRLVIEAERGVSE